MQTIEIHKLSKNYSFKTAVNDLDFQVEQGTVLGFVGPNGAGKTTTVNMLTGILPPTSGTITLLGLDLEQKSQRIKRRIGVVPEELALFEHLRGREQLYFTARVYGLEKATITERMHELFEIFGLQGQEDKFVHEYSKGMKKKLAFMCAIIHEPEILFLDEPFEGLDPISTKVIQDNLKLMSQNGVTVFLTSHNLSMVEELCTEVAIIHEGSLVFQSPTMDIRNRIKDELSGETYGDLEQLFLDLVSSNNETRYLSWLKKQRIQ